ncbi:hypothetical protein [Mariprofundus ferrooxydans]|uniref:hypothetical protein n=1 Tax=Mariprofundus ferrooxydans TaxID=314344 RepID=UPI00142F64E4|nr:hypothetical protein [Mariprofundus ferrooxydans]
MPLKPHGRQRIAAPGYPEFDLFPVVRRFRNQVTNPVYGVDAGQNPLIAAVTIHNGPNMGGWQGFHQLQIRTKCFQPDAAPNIATLLRMPKPLTSGNLNHIISLKIKDICGKITTHSKQLKGGAQMLKKGDRISILPEYRDKGDELYIWVVTGDEEKGRVDISVLNSGLPFPGIQTVPSYMVTAKRTQSGRKVSILHGPLKGIVK